MSDAAAVWRENVAALTAAFNPSQPRDATGKWTSDGSDQSAASDDAEAKALYAQLLNMPPEQRDKFLAGLNNDQLTRLGKFASLGKASDGPIADIRNKTGQAMAGRGIDPKAAGLKSTGGKKKAAKKGGAKKSGGGGSKGGGKSGGGGSSKKSGGSKSSGSKSSGSKSSGSKSSSSKSGSKTDTSTKAPKTPKAPPKPPPPPPPALDRVGPRRRPGLPSPSPGLPRPVRSSAAPDEPVSLADWNAARYAARQARS